MKQQKKKRSPLSKDDLENQKPKFMKPYEQRKGSTSFALQIYIIFFSILNKN